MVNNKLDKTFGPVGSFAGIIILLFGIYACFYSWVGITTIVVGAFLAFTNTGTIIDFENRRLKFASKLFGFIAVGHWTEIKPGMKLIVRNVSKTYTANSASNRQTSQKQSDIRIVLLNDSGAEVMAVKKFGTKEAAEKELPELTEKLKLVYNE